MPSSSFYLAVSKLDSTAVNDPMAKEKNKTPKINKNTHINLQNKI